MTTRLQVLFPDDEIAAIREAAVRQRLTVAAWVRQTLREAIAAAGMPPARKDEKKVSVVGEAARYRDEYPAHTADDLRQLEALLTRLDGEDEGAEAAWDAEIARRLEELHGGRARLIPLDDVIESIRRKHGW